jgi:hypothetical protein
MRVDATRILRDVVDRVRHLKAKPHHVPRFLEEPSRAVSRVGHIQRVARDDLGVKVDTQLQLSAFCAVLGDLEESTVNLKVPPVDLEQPSLEDGLRVELAAKAGALGLQLLAVGVQLPAFAEDVLNPPHVRVELPFDLFGPNDGA